MVVVDSASSSFFIGFFGLINSVSVRANLITAPLQLIGGLAPKVVVINLYLFVVFCTDLKPSLVKHIYLIY